MIEDSVAPAQPVARIHPVAAARERSVSILAAPIAVGVAGEQHCIEIVGLLRSFRWQLPKK
jgi:hypothetical protein